VVGAVPVIDLDIVPVLGRHVDHGHQRLDPVLQPVGRRADAQALTCKAASDQLGIVGMRRPCNRAFLIILWCLGIVLVCLEPSACVSAKMPRYLPHHVAVKISYGDTIQVGILCILAQVGNGFTHGFIYLAIHWICVPIVCMLVRVWRKLAHFEPSLELVIFFGPPKPITSPYAVVELLWPCSYDLVSSITVHIASRNCKAHRPLVRFSRGFLLPLFLDMVCP